MGYRAVVFIVLGAGALAGMLAVVVRRLVPVVVPQMSARRAGALRRWGRQIALLIPLTGLLVPGHVGAARADALVQVAPHRAGLRPGRCGPPLLGYLARPAGPGPFPAVVELHGCGGMSAHDVALAAMLRSWGYVALVLDSLGGANTCQHPGGALGEAFDAYASLRYLSGRAFVDRRRIAVLGKSMGGVAVLQIVERGLMEQLFPEHFRAAVAYYPQCRYASGIMIVPTLILVGDRDDWAPAQACRAMLARRAGKGAPVRLVVLRGATHAFDFPEPRRRYLGHLLEYDPDATRAAAAQARAFLQAVFAARPALPPARPGGTVAPK